MVSKIEKDFLVNEKELEGKERAEAIKEVKEFEYSQKQFKIMYKELKKLRRENEILDYKLHKKNQTDFKESFKRLTSEPKVTEGKCSMNNIKRIVHNMESNRPFRIKELAEELCMNTQDLNDAIDTIKKLQGVNIEFKDGRYIRK